MSDNIPSVKGWLAAIFFGAVAVLIGYSLPRHQQQSTQAPSEPSAATMENASTSTSQTSAAAPSARSAPEGKASPTPSNVAKAAPSGKSAVSAAFSPPPENAIPDNDFGKMVKLGEAIFYDTQKNAKQFVGNDLQCSNCHIDRGRLANSAPLWAAYVAYPAYRSKNGHVNTFQERMQGCFKYSMNGKAPPFNDKVLVALESYAYFLAKGAPTGDSKIKGRGYPTPKNKPASFDLAKGSKVYASHCALCHGDDGAGQKAANGTVVFPALWGAKSFNWGAGMGSIKNAAGFIKANMPLSQGNTLSDEDAWNVAAYVDSHDRPQDPRFEGSVAQTRKKYHDSKMSLYGTKVGDTLLGQNSPPAGVGH